MSELNAMLARLSPQIGEIRAIVNNEDYGIHSGLMIDMIIDLLIYTYALDAWTPDTESRVHKSIIRALKDADN